MSRVVRKKKDGFDLVFDTETSVRMRGVRRKNTAPELVVRRLLHALGIRFRIGNENLPGSPDIANRSKRWAIFVHGCYWHRHGCRATTTPTRNRAFWVEKFRRNIERDSERAAELANDGFRVVVVWECETKRATEVLRERLARELLTRH